jgi:hypothetical protein
MVLKLLSDAFMGKLSSANAAAQISERDTITRPSLSELRLKTFLANCMPTCKDAGSKLLEANAARRKSVCCVCINFFQWRKILQYVNGITFSLLQASEPRIYAAHGGTMIKERKCKIRGTL